jgi:hypothetical protein
MYPLTISWQIARPTQFSNAAVSSAYTYTRLFRSSAAIEGRSLDGPKLLVSVLSASLGLLLFLAALVLYGEKTYDPSSTPAASRHLNTDCGAFNLFDYHDLWHLTSGFGAFFVFLAMLFADEALDEKMLRSRSRVRDAQTEQDGFV